jgi:hypothetical protein
VHYRISTTVSGNEEGDSTAALGLDTWTHLAYVKASNKLKLYLNGTLDSEVGLAGTSVSNTGPLYIGKDPWSPGFSGALDDLRVYNHALSAGGVTALYTQEFILPPELEPPFVLTDQLPEDERGKRSDLAEKLLHPYEDQTSRLKLETPAYLKEVFYFVPMQLAMQLQKSGEYLAALDWYQTVYAYNVLDKPSTLKDDRKIYYDLRLEKNLPLGFSSLQRPTHWLREWLNPHRLASTRPNPYTRYTFMCLARCFLDFADAEFTRDTGESIANARALYMSARRLLLQPELQPPAPTDPNDTILPNPVLDSLRLRAETQLMKLRQGRNIAGMKRQLESDTPPQGLSGLPTIGSGGQLIVPGATVLRPTPYRYSVLIERGKQLVSLAQQIEGAYLSALEKLDGERYNLMKAGFELELAEAGRVLQDLRVTEAKRGKDLAELQMARAEIQRASMRNGSAQG